MRRRQPRPQQPYLHPRSRAVIFRLLVGCACAVASCVLLAACGTGADSSAPRPTPSPSPSPAPPQATISTAQLTYRGHSGPVIGVAWSPDGTRLATCGNDGTTQVWSATSGKVLWQTQTQPTESYTFAIAWSPDGKEVAAGGSSGSVAIFDAATGSRTLTLTGQTGDIEGIAWAPSSAYVAAGSQDGTADVWNAKTGMLVTTYHGHSGAVAHLAWSPDSTRIASAGEDRTVQIWQATTGAHVFTYTQGAPVWSVAWSPDGTRIASGTGGAGSYGPITTGNSLRIWDAATGRLLLTLVAPGQSYALAWSPNGQYLASGGDDNMAHVWDATTGTERVRYAGHHDIVFGIAWAPNGQRIATASADGTAQVWQPTL